MNSATSYLRPHCSPIVNRILFFYSVGPTFFSSLSFSFPFPVSPFLCSLSLCSMSLPPSSTKPRPEHQAYIFTDFFFFFFIHSTLSLYSIFLFPLTSFFSLLSLWFADKCAPLMIVLRRLWVADGFGPMAAMKVSSSSFFIFFIFLRGSSEVQWQWSSFPAWV